jgi:hypothetical protein
MVPHLREPCFGHSVLPLMGTMTCFPATWSAARDASVIPQRSLPDIEAEPARLMHRVAPTRRAKAAGAPVDKDVAIISAWCPLRCAVSCIDLRWAPGRRCRPGGSIRFPLRSSISGLLMADLIQRTDRWPFLGHRVIRIYPAFLLE